MSYIESNLQPDEKVLDRTRLHWIVYSGGFVLLLAAPCIFIFVGDFGPSLAEDWRYYIAPPILMAILGAVTLIGAAIRRWTTEIAITNRRIIYKTGLISRRTLEMNVDKVESVDVNQSVLGRILDYGTVLVRGVGTGLEPLKTITAPLEFRDAILLHTVSPSVSPTVPPSPPPSSSGFTGQNPAVPEAPVFANRRPIER